MISTSVKQDDDFMIEKLNTSRPSLKMATRLPLQTTSKTTGHKIKWDHFDILASGKTDYHCKIKETLLIQELKPAFNVNVSSEKLMLYKLAGAFYRFTVKIAFLILVPDPLSLLYKRFVKIATVTFENVC